MSASADMGLPVRRPLSGDDIADARDQFAACDSDGDGRIESGEFAGLLERCGSLLTSSQKRGRFEEIDSDHDGFINLGEFIEWWRGR
ncbi:MAG: EF-hand domain-containing protein [Pseudomonadota bacterium]